MHTYDDRELHPCQKNVINALEVPQGILIPSTKKKETVIFFNKNRKRHEKYRLSHAPFRSYHLPTYNASHKY